MIKSQTELVSQKEFDLLEAIRIVKFGELYGVEIPDENKWIECETTQAEHDLLDYIREGNQYIDVLAIHNGHPAYAETDMKINGFRCRRKIKFPTVHTEGRAE